ncbi:class IV lanthionine synthetase LanL [Kitasatospora sp. NPDC094019]|uniref:class IV lanthionine synthetase LanL n=1 Tax=Kitasatospora sp. NPDC094019 TaxID=3364091 RepID=UPI00382C7E36
MLWSIAGRSGWSDDKWSYLNDPRMPAMDHGWKLHISARPDGLEAVTDLVLPVLERFVCHAKFARSPQILREINSGTASAGVVGKAITVYPVTGIVVELAEELVSVLDGREGPQVVSDRRVDPRAPVYYRYGPFTGTYRTGRGGRLESVMVGPDGRAFDGLAGGSYRCPPWAEDPFADRQRNASAAGAGGEPSAPTPGMGGGRYRVTGGIVRKPEGNVYRALDRVTGASVVVKQARAFVAEDESGADTRDRLRHERTVLAALDGVTGVPRALDYFGHEADEYLVLTDCGDRNLRRDVRDEGPYGDPGPHPGDGGARPPLRELALGLLSVLDDVHQRGVVVRDLKPDNVVLDTAGRCRLIDFGIGELHGAGPDGSTPGYSAPVRRVGEPAEAADDYYALGATLYFAATGLDPVIVDADAGVNRERTLEGLAWLLPDDQHRWFRAAMEELTSLDPALRRVGAERLRALRTETPEAPEARTAPASPASPASGETRRTSGGPRRLRLDAGLLAEIVEHTTAFCVDEAHRIVDPALAARAAVPTPVDVYAGSSGLGLELLRHTDRPAVREAVDALAQWTAQQPRSPSAGFYTGRTGVELFLAEAEAEAQTAEADSVGRAQAPRADEPGDDATLPTRGPDGGPPEADMIEGVAGLGVGRLLLARRAREAGNPGLADSHLAVAAECDRMLADGRARLTPADIERAGDAALRDGMAHGTAGVAYFLAEYAAASGDPEATGRARLACARPAAVTPDIVAMATAPAATRRYGSWCRGLAGIGAVLVRSADRLDEPEHLVLAERAARTCVVLAPRMPLVTQCCGLSGVGDLMVDVALATGSEEFWEAAGTIAAIILTRSGGTRSRPVFPDANLAGASAGWAGGSAGVLAFLRRLHQQGGPRLGLIG